MLKKIDIVKNLINKHSALFRCPKCEKEMKWNEENSLVCSDGHCFDLAKKGYIYLMLRKVETHYNNKLFESRRALCQTGFYEPLTQELVGLINKYLNDEIAQLAIIDAGCGEGSNLARIIEDISANTLKEPVGMGIDIAKDGISIAARNYPGIIWAVANLADLPLADHSFDVLLNVFTPFNQQEFKRILKQDGIILKVIPEEGYLGELRDIFYKNSDLETYSNQDVVANFKQHFAILETKRVTYQFKLEGEQLSHLVNMTPLAWGAAPENIRKVTDMGEINITVDVVILVGGKR